MASMNTGLSRSALPPPPPLAVVAPLLRCWQGRHPAWTHQQRQRRCRTQCTSALPAPNNDNKDAAAAAVAGTVFPAAAPAAPAPGPPLTPIRPALSVAGAREAVGVGVSDEAAAHEAHRQLNRRICAAASADEVLAVVGGGGSGLVNGRFNLVNAVTAFHRLAKHAARLPAPRRREVASHPAARALAAWLESAVCGTRLEECHAAAQILWGHSQLGHGTAALVDAVYAQLESVEVEMPGGGGASPAGGGTSSSGCSSPSTAGTASETRGGSVSGGGLRLDSVSTAVTLVYAMARLQRPAPQLLQRLTAAMLAAPESLSGGGGGEGGVLESSSSDDSGLDSSSSSFSSEGSSGSGGALTSSSSVSGDNSWGGEGRAASERHPTKGRQQGERRASAGDDGTGGTAREASSGSTSTSIRVNPESGSCAVPEGICLEACDSRSLCLLLWSLASLRACPPPLLARACRVLRRAGLAGLSVQSMTLILQAQDLAGSWDQGLVDEVAAELVQRWQHSQPQQAQWGRQTLSTPRLRETKAAAGRRQRQQRRQQQQRQETFQLNEVDCSILTRCLAIAWQEATAVLPAENRLAAARSMLRHIAASPHRRAVLRMLAATASQLAPEMQPQGLSSLAHSFASLGGCPPALLEALAGRAIELERKLDAQAVANLAWAYSTLRYDHNVLYDSLAGAALRLLATPPSPSGHHSGDTSSYSGTSNHPGSSRNGGMRGATGASISGNSANRNGSSRGREEFNAQAVSMTVFSFATANRCGSWLQRQMFEALAERASEVLPDFTPQGLTNLAWGLTVAECYPPQLLRRWRVLAGAAAPHFKPAELNQLHLVEVALRLEAPGIGLDVPRGYESFFEELYQAGRLRAFAERSWQRTVSAGPRSVTDFQLQVHRTLCALGVPCVLEHSEAGEYSIDVALPQHRIAVEVDGPVHFAANSRHLMGGTALKRRLLQRLGWRAVDVPFYEWWELAPAQRQRYMRDKLLEAGLKLPEARPEVVVGIEGQGTVDGEGTQLQQRQEQQQQVEEETCQQPQQQQQQQRDDQGSAYSFGRPGSKGVSGAAIEAASASALAGPRLQPQRQSQERQPTSDAAAALTPGTIDGSSSTSSSSGSTHPSTDSSNGSSSKPPGRPHSSSSSSGSSRSGGGERGAAIAGNSSRSLASSITSDGDEVGASMAQRAQRLNMLQYRQGKLSRQGLLSRESMQATAGTAGKARKAGTSAVRAGTAGAAAYVAGTAGVAGVSSIADTAGTAARAAGTANEAGISSIADTAGLAGAEGAEKTAAKGWESGGGKGEEE